MSFGPIFPSTRDLLNKHLLSWKSLHLVLFLKITHFRWVDRPKLRWGCVSSWGAEAGVKGLLDSTVCHRVVWALTTTYGVVYFYNVIIPPPATTPLKLSACWGKNSVKSPADPDTAEHKQWSWGLGNTHSTHGHTTAHTLPHAFVAARKLLHFLQNCPE